MRDCSKCGKQIAEDAKFCDNCGATILKGESDNAKSKNHGVVDWLNKKRKRYFFSSIVFLCVFVIVLLAIGLYGLAKEGKKRTEAVSETEQANQGDILEDDVKKDGRENIKKIEYEKIYVRTQQKELITGETIIYNHDEYGNIVKEVWYNAEGDVEQTGEHTFDECGNCIKTEWYFGDGQIWYSMEWEYDASGHCTKETEYRDNQTKSIKEWIYDISGNQTKEICYYENELEYMYEWTYDAAGNCTKRVEYDGAQVKYIFDMTYDEHGKWVETIERDSDEVARYIVEGTYDPNGTWKKEVAYDMEDNSVYKSLEWIYDANGNCIKYEVSYRPGVIWDSFIIEYSYDTNGNKIKEIKYNPEGSIEERYEWEYDSNNNCIKQVHYNFAKHSETQYEFTYEEMDVVKKD